MSTKHAIEASEMLLTNMHRNGYPFTQSPHYEVQSNGQTVDIDVSRDKAMASLAKARGQCVKLFLVGTDGHKQAIMKRRNPCPHDKIITANEAKALKAVLKYT